MKKTVSSLENKMRLREQKIQQQTTTQELPWYYRYERTFVSTFQTKYSSFVVFELHLKSVLVEHTPRRFRDPLTPVR